jgi:hypothetical protein
MNEEPDWKAIRDERISLVRRILSLPFADAWAEIRPILSVPEFVGDIDDGPRIYTLPTRAYLLPLPWELLRGFVSTFGTEALDVLFDCSNDSNPVLAAYALYALAKQSDARLVAACGRASLRPESVSIVGGCFVHSLTLGEYAQQISKESSNEPGIA